MHSWQRWTLGILTIGGGVTGIALGITFLDVSISWLPGLVSVVFLTLYLWGTWCGIKILKGSPEALRSSMPFWSIQIPVIQSSFASYIFSNGAFAGVLLKPTEHRFDLQVWIGSQAEISVMTGKPLTLGINVFALFVVVWLWRLVRVQASTTSLKPELL